MKSSQEIQQLFGAIAPGYDRANTFLSLGIHHLWRKSLVEWSEARPGDAVLDCATGTGDLAVAFKKIVGPAGGVLGTDFSREMLSGAQAKATGKGIQWEHADATALPYPDNIFDIVSIAFGIRNIPDLPTALRELSRVCKPGGKVMVLEFGQPRLPVIKQLYRVYSQTILPRVGGWITGEPEAYKYLEESSARFPYAEDFVALMRRHGNFTSVDYKGLSAGIAYMYKGVKTA